MDDLEKQETLIDLAVKASEIRKNAVKITWDNVEFEVTKQLPPAEAKQKGVKTEKQMIIKNVSGYAMPG